MGLKVVSRDGGKEAFDEKKLYASVFYPAREAEYGREEAEEMANDLTEDVRDWIEAHEDNVVTSRELREKVVELLEERDDGVAFLYDTHMDIN